MTSFARLKMYVTQSKDAKIELNPAEDLWWNGNTTGVFRRAFWTAVAAIGTGIVFGALLTATVTWAAGAPFVLFPHGWVFMVTFGGTVGLAVGYRHLIRTERENAIRSRRLRLAMDLGGSDQADSEKPTTLDATPGTPPPA